MSQDRDDRRSRAPCPADAAPRFYEAFFDDVLAFHARIPLPDSLLARIRVAADRLRIAEARDARQDSRIRSLHVALQASYARADLAERTLGDFKFRALGERAPRGTPAAEAVTS